MLSITQLVGIAALGLSSSSLISRVAADAVPTSPGPGDSFNEGSPCPIQWNLDTTGTWTDFTIQLMTGSNFQMTPLATVASGLDGTKGEGKYEWTCPEVEPNSAIYFYQFTQTGGNTSWTTRFTIASATGETTEPTETTMVNGVAVGYGTGRLSGASVSLSPGAGASGAASSGLVGGGGGAASSMAASVSSVVSSSPSTSSGMMTSVVTTSSTPVETSQSSSSSVSQSSSSRSSINASGASNAAQSAAPANSASSLLSSTSVVVGSLIFALSSLAVFA
ncbi:hypothetical protein JCM5353_003008 [Sporobolomyces roseus]